MNDNRRNPDPKISVIMNCYNGASYLKDAIDSVYGQTYGNWEIVFWDNASNDESPQIAKWYDSKLRYYRGDSTVPLYAARNMAVREARGEYITFLDVDDVWLPSKLQSQIDRFEQSYDAALVYTNYYKRDVKRGVTRTALRGCQPEGRVFTELSKKYPICISSVMLKREILGHRTQLFDERMNLCGDYDAFMRILYRNKAAYVPRPLVIYRIHENMCSDKHADQYAEEYPLVIDNLKREFGDLEKECAEELENLMALSNYLKAVRAMRHGRLLEARKFVKPFKNMNAKMYMTYLCTYLPVGVWRWCRDVKALTFGC